jgi:hypothetical protein
VIALLREGLTVTEIARRLVSKPTVCFHMRTLGIQGESKFSRRYDWAEIRAYWSEAVRRGDIEPRPRGAPLEQVFVDGVRRNRYYLKGRLLANRIKVSACEECGLSEWRGKVLPLELHHVTGNPNDHRLHNLQLICPNCHAITPNWGGRAKLKRAA